MNQNKLGELIKNLRKENHLTQKEFAELFNVTYQAVSKWENGVNIPDIAILKEMSNKFSLDINYLLDGEVNKSKKNKKRVLVFFLGLLLVVFFILLYLFTHNHDFTFKNVRSDCDDFTVLGNIAYNDNKTSINISSISCLNDEAQLFNEIITILYEEHENTKTIISKDEYYGEKITLNNYLNTVEFNIDDYESTCKNYTDNSLSIELKATNENGDIITYEIPLRLNDNCISTAS